MEDWKLIFDFKSLDMSSSSLSKFEQSSVSSISKIDRNVIDSAMFYFEDI